MHYRQRYKTKLLYQLSFCVWRINYRLYYTCIYYYYPSSCINLLFRFRFRIQIQIQNTLLIPGGKFFNANVNFNAIVEFSESCVAHLINAFVCVSTKYLHIAYKECIYFTNMVIVLSKTI